MFFCCSSADGRNASSVAMVIGKTSSTKHRSHGIINPSKTLIHFALDNAVIAEIMKPRDLKAASMLAATRPRSPSAPFRGGL
jgi:hypothetical protein